MVHQFYQSRVSDEFVLRGNAGILKCLIPSFVTDFIEVDAWVSNDGETFVENNSDLGKILIGIIIKSWNSFLPKFRFFCFNDSNKCFSC